MGLPDKDHSLKNQHSPPGTGCTTGGLTRNFMISLVKIFGVNSLFTGHSFIQDILLRE